MDVEAADGVVDSRDLQPDALDCVHGLQSLGTNFRAIHDGAAAEQPVGIIVQVVSSRSVVARSRLSKMKRYAWIRPAGPTNLSGFHQYEGH